VFTSEPYYRRGKPTARIEVKCEGNLVRVVSRNVRKFRLRISPDLFTPGEVHVVVNGKDVAEEATELPLRAVLEDYARDADAGRLATREIVVSLESGD